MVNVLGDSHSRRCRGARTAAAVHQRRSSERRYAAVEGGSWARGHDRIKARALLNEAPCAFSPFTSPPIARSFRAFARSRATARIVGSRGRRVHTAPRGSFEEPLRPVPLPMIVPAGRVTGYFRTTDEQHAADNRGKTRRRASATFADYG